MLGDTLGRAVVVLCECGRHAGRWAEFIQATATQCTVFLFSLGLAGHTLAHTRTHWAAVVVAVGTVGRCGRAVGLTVGRCGASLGTQGKHLEKKD